MDSLQAMMQLGLKNSAAYALPQQQQNERQMADAKLREQQLANDNSATMNPLNAQFKQGQINEQGAVLPGQQAQSRMLGLQADEEQQLAATKVAQKFSSLTNQIGVDGVQKMGRDGAIASQVSQALLNYPPALHKQILPKLISSYGGDPNSPTFQGIMQMPDGAVAKSLGALGKGMAMASAEYMQKSALQSNENQSQEKIAGGHDATSIKVAQIQADAKKQVASARASALAKIPKTEDKIALLEEAEANGSATPEESDLLRRLKTHVYNERTLAAPAVAPTVLNQETPTDRAARLAGGSKPAAPAAKTIVRTGTSNGRKVVQYSDGSVEYAN